MDNTPAKTTLLTRLADSIRHPMKLRLVLCPIILGTWYFLFFSPLSDEMVATQARIEKERKRIAIARQVDEIRKSLNAYKDRVPPNSELNELMQYVIGRIRKSPLKLVDLKPEKPKTLGPYDAIILRLTLEGNYRELHELLNWAQSEQRLLRVESLSLTPARQDMNKSKTHEPLKLSIQLVLAALMEKASAEKPSEARRG